MRNMHIQRVNFHSRRREKGVVLVIALLILVIMTTIGLSATQSTSLQEKIAGNTKQKTSAFFASEAGTITAERYIAEDTKLTPAPKDSNSAVIINAKYLEDLAGETPWWKSISRDWWHGRAENAMPKSVTSDTYTLSEGGNAYYAIAKKTFGSEENIVERAHLGVQTYDEPNIPSDFYDVYSVGEAGPNSSAREMVLSHFVWRHRK